jgi:integrase/recombinase XerD
MNTLREALCDYFELRRGLGFKLHDAWLQLPRFVSFLEQRGERSVTGRLALEWAQQSSTVQPAEWARRLGFVRGFARYRSAIDPATEVPAVGLLPHRSKRARPYLYTEQEIARLLAAALTLPTAWPSTPLRPVQYHCLLGLLSVTGLRIAEALHLELRDVDLEQSVLTIRAAKHGRSRLVPIHASTAAVLVEYLRCREQAFGAKCTNYVFVSNVGNRLDGARCTEPSTRCRARWGCVDPRTATGRACTTCGTASRSRRCCTGMPRARTWRAGCRCCPPSWATCMWPTHTGT